MIISTIILCLSISLVLKRLLANKNPKKITVIILSLTTHFVVMFLNFVIAGILSVIYKPGFATSMVALITYYIIKPDSYKDNSV